MPPSLLISEQHIKTVHIFWGKYWYVLYLGNSNVKILIINV